MPPKKSDKSASSAVTESSIKPEDAEFFLQCLKAFDSNGVMDIAAVSTAIGHTNVMSTRNAFGRLKKKWGLGNIPTKTFGAEGGGGGGGSGKSSQKTDEDSGSGQYDVLKRKISNGSKVVKKRARAAPKSKPSNAVKTEEDADATESDIKNDEGSEEDE